MDIQTIIVGLIIIFAATYFGFEIFKKGKSFQQTKKNCGDECGCD